MGKKWLVLGARASCPREFDPSNPKQENESGGMRRTPNALRLRERVLLREAFGVRGIPALSFFMSNFSSFAKTQAGCPSINQLT
ncbi:MAG: hypothetical protein C5B50_14745 [Verrucomicrobia bacterium]|nr:MAG: hypothetical protein C5B50_14745 [Verrucomicrobiota bacterium]